MMKIIQKSIIILNKWYRINHRAPENIKSIIKCIDGYAEFFN